MLRLALRTLRFRPGVFVAVFVVTFSAASILMACGGLIETGIRSAVPAQQLRHADIVVTGDQEYHDSGGDPDEPPILTERVRIDAGLERTISALPGVVRTEGHVFEGEAPAGTIDAIGVVAEPGTDVGRLRDRIDAELDDTATTLVGDQRGQAERRGAKTSGLTVVAMAGVLTAFALAVSIFGVASMLALSIAQRRRDLALMRAVGATPRQLRRQLVRETLLLAVVTTALAVVPGQLLGRFVFDLLAERGIAGDGIVFYQGWIPTVAAMGVAIFAAVAGAVGAGRRVAKIRPTQALAEVDVEGKLIGAGRLAAAVVLLGGGFALVLITMVVMSGPLAPATAAPAVIVLGIGFALAAPVLSRVTTFVAQWPVRALGGVTGLLAVLNARSRANRMAAAIAPVVLLTTVATGLLYLQATSDLADRRTFADNLVAETVISTDGHFDTDLVAHLDAMPGVAAASEYVESTGFIEHPHDSSPMHEGWKLQGVTASGAAATTPVAVTAGDFADLHGATIALAAHHADNLGVGVGDRITLRMGDNTATDLRVVALFNAPEGYDTLLLPADTLAAHTTAGVVQRMLVRSAEHSDPATLQAKLTAWAHDRDNLTVSGRDVILEAFDEEKKTANFAILIMVVMIGGYAAITVINTLASSTVARRREFGLQRLAGSTRSQVTGMVCLEGAIVAVSGVVLGTLAAGAVLVPVSLKRLGTVLPAGSPWMYVSTASLCVALTLAAMVLPALRATRGRPAAAALAAD